MITPEEFVEMLNKENGNRKRNVIFGTVVDVTGNPRILLDGETTASIKRYPHLSSYKPTINDRVLVLNGTVIGRIGEFRSEDDFYSLTQPNGYAIDLPNNTDLNTVLNSGIYRLGFSFETQGLAVGTYFFQVYRGPASVVQIGIMENVNQGDTYIRTRNAAGNWSVFRKFIRNDTIIQGSGSPEGVVTAPVGSIYQRTNGGAGTTLYVKESGSGNTGWKAVQTT